MSENNNLRFAVCCSSNMNRSMEAHSRLQKKGFNVLSFGTGDKIKLPGPSLTQPNVYEFGTSYEEIYQDLARKDKSMSLAAWRADFTALLLAVACHCLIGQH